jgi:argininosuccinate lyase/amino-acid N-acetyltransferase
MAALWGGRFEGTSDPLFKRFNDSLPFDYRLVRDDLTGSIAWAKAIAKVGVISDEELRRLVAALEALRAEVDQNPAAIVASAEEDVHSWVESELVKRVGDLGKKLHTGRSRNDQVATDLRLWCRGACEELLAQLRRVRGCLIALAERDFGPDGGTILPGYTHLQRGQPILFAHWALAYAEMLARDTERLTDARDRANRSPLGSGALAGTAYPVDRAALAKDLGFDEPLRNSLDAVGDRDFVFEILSACAMTALHLSRFAEDVILYATAEFAFVKLHDSVTSGSSLMPQKKNPDALELIRGKAGRVIGAQTALAVTMKGLPLAYNKDLQEDKEPLFDAVEHLSLCLAMCVPVIEKMSVNRAACEAAALGDGTILATDLADYLVTKGVPFRDAHHAAGRASTLAVSSGLGLHRLSVDQLRAVHPAIGPDVSEWLTLRASVGRRVALGGTSPARVAEAIAEARRRLQG